MKLDFNSDEKSGEVFDFFIPHQSSEILKIVDENKTEINQNSIEEQRPTFKVP